MEPNLRPPDLRRATSREAARKRRRVESDMFGDLSRLLPLHLSIRQRLDKPTVIRLTLSYIRTHALLKGRTLGVGGGGTEIWWRLFWTVCPD